MGFPDSKGNTPGVTLVSHEGICEFALSDHSATVSVFNISLAVAAAPGAIPRQKDAERGGIGGVLAVFKEMSVSSITKDLLREVLEQDCKFTKAGVDSLFKAVPFTGTRIGINELLDWLYAPRLSW